MLEKGNYILQSSKIPCACPFNTPWACPFNRMKKIVKYVLTNQSCERLTESLSSVNCMMLASILGPLKQ